MSERQQIQGMIRAETAASVAPPDFSRRLRGVRAILMGLAVLASCVGAYLLARCLARSLQDDGGSPPAEYVCDGLVVAAADLDLGDVWDAAEFVQDLTIRNPSRSEKRIDNFAASCICTAVEPNTVVVPPGGTATVHVHIDPNHHRSPDDINQAVRPFAVEVTPILDSGRPRESGWVIQGRFKSRVTINALTVHFGEEVVQGLPAPARKVVASLHVPMRRLEAKVEPPAIGTVKLVPRPDHPDQVELQITPASTLPIGPFQATVIVNVVGPSGEVTPGAILPIAGAVQPEARLLPAQLFLAAKPVGQTADAVVVLQAPTDSAVTVDHIETDSADLSVEPTDVAGVQHGRAFRVCRRLTEEGDQSGAATFVLRRAGQEAVQLTVKVFSRAEASRPTLANPQEARQP